MKQFGIYIGIIILGTACTNQADLAGYDDDNIYAPVVKQRSGAASAEDAYYFVEESEPENTEQREYYGTDNPTDGETVEDDYVPEVKSLPTESGRAYSNQRYNQPTTYSSYASTVPITIRLRYSSFYHPYYSYGPTFSFGIGVGGCMDPWWGYYDPWDPWCRWNRWSRWNSWYAWNTWTPYCPWGVGWSNAYAMGYYHGFYHGLNAYNYYSPAEIGSSHTYYGPRPGYSGGSLNAGIPSEFQPRNASKQTASFGQKTPLNSATRGNANTQNRIPNIDEKPGATKSPGAVRTPAQSRSPEQLKKPQSTDTKFDENRMPRDPVVSPSRTGTNKPTNIKWNNSSRTPGINQNNSKPNLQFKSPSREVAPSRNYTPTQSPVRTPAVTPRSASPSRSSGSSSGGSKGSTPSKRGGFR